MSPTDKKFQKYSLLIESERARFMAFFREEVATELTVSPDRKFVDPTTEIYFTVWLGAKVDSMEQTKQ